MQADGGATTREQGSLHLEADVLQVLGVLLDDLLNEVRVSGAQVRRRRLVELELEPPPQVRRVEDVVPAAAHGRGPGAVHQGQVLEDLQHHVVRQVAPVLGRGPLLGPLVSLGPLLLGEGPALGLEICPSSFHSEKQSGGRGARFNYERCFIRKASGELEPPAAL